LPGRPRRRRLRHALERVQTPGRRRVGRPEGGPVQRYGQPGLPPRRLSDSTSLAARVKLQPLGGDPIMIVKADQGPVAASSVRWAAVLACTALLAACASVAPPPPAPGPVANLPEVPESVVSVHASADYASMSAAVSKASPVHFANVAAVDLGPLITLDVTG